MLVKPGEVRKTTEMPRKVLLGSFCTDPVLVFQKLIVLRNRQLLGLWVNFFLIFLSASKFDLKNCIFENSETFLKSNLDTLKIFF